MVETKAVNRPSADSDGALLACGPCALAGAEDFDINPVDIGDAAVATRDEMTGSSNMTAANPTISPRFDNIDAVLTMP